MGAPEYEEGILTGATEGEGVIAKVVIMTPRLTRYMTKPLRLCSRIVVASISLVQRHLRIGYNRSARLIEAMEKAGLVSTMDGRGGREVLAPNRAGDDKAHDFD